MKNIKDRINNALTILIEIKSLLKMGALASDSCIIDDELQLEDNVEYYFLLRRISSLVRDAEDILQN